MSNPNHFLNIEILNRVANGNTVTMHDDEEECIREEIGTGRYGCRCKNCCEGIYTENEDKEER